MLFQMRSGQQVLWTRRVSAQPDGVVLSVESRGVEPVRLGPYGWQMTFRTRRGELAKTLKLFVDPGGQFLFYLLAR